MYPKLSRLLLMFSLWAAVAWSKDRPTDPPDPLFKSLAFHFSDIDTICIAPTIDVRVDQGQALNLSGPNQYHVLFGGVPHVNADQALTNIFSYIGYKTVGCDPINGTSPDLKAPTAEEWLGKLNFGNSRWLFVLAVEEAGTEDHGYAVVSGYLFDKQAAGGSLVWRDRAVGNGDTVIGTLVGAKKAVHAIESERAIADGAVRILTNFETRKKTLRLGNPQLRPPHTEFFAGVNCDVLWAALNDTLKNSGKYRTMDVDNSDRMAIYAVGTSRLTKKRINYVVLKNNNTGCGMRGVETDVGIDDVKELNKRVRESLSHISVPQPSARK